MKRTAVYLGLLVGGMALGAGIRLWLAGGGQNGNSVVIVSGGTSGEVRGASEVKEQVSRVRIIAVGDVMLGRAVNASMQERDDFGWPFEEVAGMLAGADLTLGNLESPLMQNCPTTREGMIFCGDKRAAEGLFESGFDVMSLANNHALNYGGEGRQMTKEILGGKEIKAAMQGHAVEGEVKELSYTILAYDDVSEAVDRERAVGEIEQAAGERDLVIVMVHWGVEYTAEPSGRQVELGRAMVDAGARMVLGAHPHWVQPVEKYNGGIIAYSLGNLVFDQMWSEETRKGAVLEVNLEESDGEIMEIEHDIWLVRIYDYGQPRLE